MLARKTPLKRTASKLKRTPLRRVSKKRSKELMTYAKRRASFLIGHPICEVWCKENGWTWLGYVGRAIYGNQNGRQVPAEVLSMNFDAPTAMEIHHKAKRRGAMLNDESQWLAVCRANHERIENNKSWARANGFLLNF